MKKEVLLERAMNMAINPTRAEKKFRDRLKENKIKFRTQWVIGFYIVDFLIGKIVVEIDGKSHDNRKEYDRERTKYLQSLGYWVVRIKNEDVETCSLRMLKQKSKPKSKKKPINLSKIKSNSATFKKLGWDKQRVILQRERLHGI